MISVIVPCYNCSATVCRTLASLENQKYKNFEVIIVNDGSTDDTNKKIESYMRKSKMNILLFNQENAGVSAARNFGIEKSNGEFICFLDADDEYSCSFLYLMNKSITSKKSDFSICQFKYNTEKSKNSEKLEYSHMTKYQAFDLFKNKRINKINMWSFLYRKSIIIDNNIKFSEDLKYGEDTEFVCKYLFHCSNGGFFLKSGLYKYYLVESSAMHKVSYDKIQNIYAFQRIEEYWEKDDKWDKSNGTYMISRAIWAAAKDFAIEDNECYEKLIKDFDVDKAMKFLSEYADEMLVKITSEAYCINRNMFIFFVNMYKIFSKIKQKI